jgi:hypothetical protein
MIAGRAILLVINFPFLLRIGFAEMPGYQPAFSHILFVAFASKPWMYYLTRSLSKIGINRIDQLEMPMFLIWMDIITP